VVEEDYKNEKTQKNERIEKIENEMIENWRVK
jgi:hypothetical protein